MFQFNFNVIEGEAVELINETVIYVISNNYTSLKYKL